MTIVIFILTSPFTAMAKRANTKLNMNKFDENPVNASEAAKILGVSTSTISALKRSMGIKSRKVFVSALREFLRKHPQWKTSDVYHKNCKCLLCLKKRAAKVLAQQTVSAAAVQESCAFAVPCVSKGLEAVGPSTTDNMLAQSSDGNSVHVSTNAKGGLGAKLRFLRGNRVAAAIAKKAGLSRESVFRIERGDPVKLPTVKGLAVVMGASRADYLDLIISWIKQTVGKDAEDLVIQARAGERPKNVTILEHQAENVRRLLERLSMPQREHLIQAMQNREILKCMSLMVTMAGSFPKFTNVVGESQMLPKAESDDPVAPPTS